MRKSNKIVIAGLLSASLLGGVALAHNRSVGFMGPGHFGGPHGGHFIEHFGDQLDLSVDQEAKLDALMEMMHKMRRDTRKDRHENKKQMAALLESPTLDQQKALELFTQNLEKMEQRAAEVIAAIAAFTDPLTSEQKEQIKEWLDHRMQARGPGPRWQH